MLWLCGWIRGEWIRASEYVLDEHGNDKYPISYMWHFRGIL